MRCRTVGSVPVSITRLFTAAAPTVHTVRLRPRAKSAAITFATAVPVPAGRCRQLHSSSFYSSSHACCLLFFLTTLLLLLFSLYHHHQQHRQPVAQPLAATVRLLHRAPSAAANLAYWHCLRLRLRLCLRLTVVAAIAAVSCTTGGGGSTRWPAERARRHQHCGQGGACGRSERLRSARH